jgi:long-subunit fatty acid transport protein
MKKYIILLIIVLVSNTAGFAVTTGTTGAQFLKIGPGARAAALGGAYVAVVEDATATYWNPAGLKKISNTSVSAMYGVWFQGVNYQFAGAAKNLGGFGAVGVSLIMLDSGDIEGYDVTGSPAAGYKTSDTMIGVSYARKIGKVNVGLNAKSISEKIAAEEASCLGIDIGVCTDFGKKISFGASVLNAVGTGLEYFAAKHSLPMIIKAGVGYRISDSMQITGEVNVPDDNIASIHAGFEYLYNNNIAIRAGYNSAIPTCVSAGLGFFLGDLSVEYACVPYGILGDTHRISLSFKFKSIYDGVLFTD